MNEEINRINCPEEFFKNCKNAYLRCDECSAGGGKSNLLLYQPVKGDKKKHPEYKAKRERRRSDKKQEKEKKKPNSDRTKKALKKEKNVKDKIIKQTIGSGRVNNDGDYHLLEGEIQADHKYRSTTNSFSLSYSEYEYGKKQGTNTWIITNAKNETMVVMPLELYTKLLKGQSNGSENS